MKAAGSGGAPRSFERSASTVGAALGFNFSAGGTHQSPDFSFAPAAAPPSLDAEAIEAKLGGLLSPSTLRAASDVRAPAAAQLAASSPSLDEKTISRLAEQIGSQNGENEGGDTHFHNHAAPITLKGNVSHDAKMLAKELNRQVKKNMVHLKSSETFRKTPRSQ